jgi:uncharacterized protein (TIGR02118 family)
MVQTDLGSMDTGVRMLKRIGIIKRPDGMTHEAFCEYWRQVHGPIALQIPGLLGYRLNFVVKWVGENTQDWDGFAELWFEDEDAMARGFAALADDIEADLPHFVGAITVGVVEEHVLRSV